MTEENGKQDRERILEKIKKLLAMARDGRGNVNEAEAAARQAQALMRKHNIEHLEAIEQELRNEESIVQEARRSGMTTHKTTKSSVPDWCSAMAYGCAKLFDAFVFIRKMDDGNRFLIFAGMRADAQVAAWTFDYLVDTVTRASKQFTRDCRKRGDRRSLGDTRVRQRSFRLGMATEILQRLLQLKKQQMGEAVPGQNALVVMKEQKIKEKLGLDYSEAKRQNRLDFGSYGAGVSEGRKARLTPNPISNQPNNNQQKVLR
jgi:hypothetical protein